MGHADDVDGTYGSRFRRDAVKEGQYFLFVGNGNVQSAQFGIGVQHLREIVDVGDLKVLVHGIDVFVVKLLVEVADGERVSQGESDKSVLVHNTIILFSCKIHGADAKGKPLEAGL